MIHYQLRCGGDHAFDGWFKDSAAFETQAQHGLIACPECGDTGVSRALMAPAVVTARPAAPRPAPAVDESSPPRPGSRPGPTPGEAAPAAGLPDAVRAALQRLRAEVEKRCDYVGADFAEEARRIHRGESEARGIYGEALPDQAEALAEEGIEVAQIPWLPRAES